MAGVQKKEESKWQNHNASIDGLTRGTPSNGTHTQHPWGVEEQRGTSHHEEKRSPVAASAPGPCDHEKGSSTGGESIRERIMYTAISYATRNQAAPTTLPINSAQRTLMGWQ